MGHHIIVCPRHSTSEGACASVEVKQNPAAKLYVKCWIFYLKVAPLKINLFEKLP